MSATERDMPFQGDSCDRSASVSRADAIDV